MSHVLTADGGTESLRVRIYDLEGRCVASHAEPYETKFMAGARAEQNAEDWWSSLVTATQICLKEANISGDAIDAMAYATILSCSSLYRSTSAFNFSSSRSL